MLRYRQQDDRCRFLYAHAAKRILCNAYTGIGNTELEFAENQNKKPFLVNSELKFNLSHSGKWIALIFQNGNDCGIDTEKIRHDFDYDFFASKNYHLRECQSLLNHDGSQSHKLFFRYWTRNEAWLKITGMGVFDGLKFIDTSDGINLITIPVNEVNVNMASQYYLHSFEYENNYFCLCTTIAKSNISIMNLNLLLNEYTNSKL
jgi:4'-phosphopantetheinyl transferase